MSYTQVRDNRILQEEPGEQVYQVRKGANSAVYTRRRFLAPSSSNMSIVLPVCARGVGRDRTHVYLHVKGSIVVAGNGLSVDNLDNGVIGWKPYPLNRNFSSVQHIIGSADETIQTAQIIDVLANMNLTPKKANYYPNTQPDFYADYNALVGTTLNPLSTYSNNVDGDTYKSRCIGITKIVATPGAQAGTSLTVNFDLIEPLITAFTFLGTEDEPALFNIPSEQININSVGSMSDMLGFVNNSIDAGCTITTQTTTITEAELEVCYVSMDVNEVSETSTLLFPTFQFQPSNNYGLILNSSTPGTPQTKTITSTINYQNIPDKVIYVARQAWNQRTVRGPSADPTANPPIADPGTRSSFPDRFLVLDKPQVSLNNLPSALNGASKRQTFDVSKRNGYAGSFEHFAGLPLDYGDYNLIGAGSCLILDPVLDLGLSQSGLSNDVNANYTLQATFDAENYLVDPDDIDNSFSPIISSLELACIVMTKKELVRNGLDYISRPFSISTDDASKVLDMKEADAVPASEVKENEDRLQGGGFGSFLSKAKSAFQWGMKNKDKLKDLGLKAKELYDSSKGGYLMGGYEMAGSVHKKKASHKGLKLHKYK